MQTAIPLYTADGELWDWISAVRMARLEGLGLIRVVRHKKGHVARCILQRRPGDSKPMQPSDYLGTRYRYQERLDNGRRCWQLRRLGRGDELRPIFESVVAGCVAAP